ncbi:MAG: DUF3667 domain-containing protein [Casimicrobiaceae bacterium]
MSDAAVPVLTPATSVAMQDRARHCHNCDHALGAGDEYCGRCGQETRIALPTARQFMREAAGRYVAVDGRLWRTLRAFAHPGLLTREYIAGRRRRYVRPGRLFLVTSIVVFTAIRLATHDQPGTFEAAREAARANQHAADAGKGPATATRTTAAVRKSATAQGNQPHDDDPGVILRTDKFNVSLDDDMKLHVDGNGPALGLLRDRVEHFNALPRTAKGDQLMTSAFRYGPYAAIALLPAFALMLKIAFPFSTRRYRDRPRRFAAHLVFAAHSHAFLFLLTAIMVVVPWPTWVVSLVPIAAAYYLLRSMRVVYGGGWPLTLLRGFVLLALYSIAFAVVTIGLLALAVVLQ